MIQILCFVYVFQQLGAEMKVAAGEHDGTLGRGYEEKVPHIAARIETGFERELVYLHQTLRGNNFLVDFGLLDLVHVGADQTRRVRRDAWSRHAPARPRAAGAW